MKRIVLLGASNLTLAFPEVAAMAAAGLAPGPFRVLAAAGHGRAYAVPGRVLGRGLPPIAACGLWAALEREPGLPTRALVADIGNDLPLGADVAQTLAAVASCLGRLRAAGAEILVVPPPLAGVASLSRPRFAILRSLLFPGRRLDRDTIVRRLRRLATDLPRLAETVGAQMAELDPRWLGGDGIHIRWRHRHAAWRSLLAGWRPPPSGAILPGRLRWTWRLAERASLLTVPRRRSQPARRLADGSTLCCF